MSKFQITGGRQLSGRIKVAGNKNAVLPIMAACLLTEDTCIIENAPQISDVEVMVELLKRCGVKVSGIGTPELKIFARDIHTADFPETLTQKLRASILLLAPVLARLGKIKMGYPGGDIIGRRPLDVHIQVLKALGAQITESNDTVDAKCESFKGAEIFLEEASVTATENAIMAAVCAQGETTIKRAAS